MMKRLKYLALASLVAFAACDEGDSGVAPAVGTVTVSVTAGGEAVNGATVTLTGESTQSMTTAGGSASFTNVVGGTYAVTLSGIPEDYVFASTSQTVTINTDGQTATVSFTGAIVRTASISGQVTASGTGVEGVEITIDGPEGTEVANSNTAGNYAFTGLRSGAYTVTITGNPDDEIYTFTSTEQDVALGVGEAAVVNFGGVETLPGSIVGTVTASGDPVEGATVTIDGPETASKQTSAAGNFSFTTLTPGTYTVTLTNPDEELYVCPDTEETVELASDETEQVDFGCELIPDPEIAIESLSQDADDVSGTLFVTVNVRPRGAKLNTVQLIAENQETGELFLVGTQTFVETAPPEEQPEEQDDEDDAIDIEFQWRTDAIRRLDGSHPTLTMTDDLANAFAAIEADADRPYHPIFVNGLWNLRARVLSDNTDPRSAVRVVELDNSDALNLGVVSDNSNWDDPETGEQFPNTLIETDGDNQGLRWLSGDIHITAYPIIYSKAYDPNDPLLQRANFRFDGFVSGVDVTRGGVELTAPNGPANTFRFSFCELGGSTAQDGSTCYASIAQLNTGFIGARNVVLTTKTEFGQFGPGFNAGVMPVVNNIKSISLFTTELQSGTGVINDVMRVDNESPVPGSMDENNISHPANAYTGVAGFLRSALGVADLNFGWANWNDVLTGLVDDPPEHSNLLTGPPDSDRPNYYPDLDKNGTDVASFCDPAGNCAVANGLNLIGGIGYKAGNEPNYTYINGPDVAADPSSCTVTGGVGAVIAGADVTELGAITGADLPPETDSPGLTDAGSAEGTPFSDRECDYAITARHWDLFGNWSNAENYLMLGVDGRAPIYSNAAGTTDPNNGLNLVDPTSAGTVYNTYDDDFYDLDLRAVASPGTFGNTVWNSTTTGAAPFNLGKAKGAYEGYTTDRGNGFSGVAGVVVRDWEASCSAGLVCAPADQFDERWGFTLQPPVPGGAAVILPFRFDGQDDISPAGSDTFVDVSETGRIPLHLVGADFHAYVAMQDVDTGPAPWAHDGYRDHDMETWDRAGNAYTDEAPSENNADHTGPNVGNVQMPTVVTFNVNDDYSFLGENLDNVDLKKSDFSFDFNSILSLQVYASPAAASHPNFVGPTPPTDVDGVMFEETSLQLPLNRVEHAPFGSQSINRGGQLSIMTDFLACLVRADEYGVAMAGNESTNDLGDIDPLAEPRVHRPRGPRWRTWDHSSAYGLVNTQFNTFVPTSLPTCLTPAQVSSNFVPALGSVGPGPDGVLATPDDGAGPDGIFGSADDDAGWIFQIRSGRPVITFKGAAGNFVPNIEPEDLAIYYLDTAGRAQLLENSAFSLIVSDGGGGAFGRWYEYTLTNPIPSDLIDNVNAPTNGTVGGWFFIVRGTNINGNTGHGVIWDETSNPAGMVAFDALATDGTVLPTPGGSAGVFQFMSVPNTGYLVQGNAALDLQLRVNPINNQLTVADGEYIGLSEHEFVGFRAPGAAAITVSTGVALVGEVNAQVCVTTPATVGTPVLVTLADATDCKLQPGPGATLAGGNQLNAQYVWVNLAAGSSYTFTADTDGGAGDLLDPAMILLSPTGLPVAGVNADDDIGVLDETFNYVVPAGASGGYLLMVYGGPVGFGNAKIDGEVTVTIN